MRSIIWKYGKVILMDKPMKMMKKIEENRENYEDQSCEIVSEWWMTKKKVKMKNYLG